MTLGKECDAHSGINEHFILSQKNSRQCVAILISFTGNNSEMIKIAKYLKRQESMLLQLVVKRVNYKTIVIFTSMFTRHKISLV